MKTLIATSILALSLSSSLALGQDKGGGGDKGGGEVRYQKAQTINFEDDTIEGDLTKPDGEYVEARKKVNHANLIKVREDFKDKVMESVSEL